MKNQLVTVKYIFEGKQFDHENEQGVLLPNNRVLVTKDSFGIYEAIATSDPNIYIVDLDNNSTDYFPQDDENFLINLIAN
ncbi:hypothetical protein [Gottfriedia luciferensis]|uniref:hypothetical protein n=1 Tax=Gottfriedia luciferensis TaxID=178774 RepID=UPI000B43CF2C|nr:hypothetical protein [Gottfriedia luciferensis]